MTAPLDNTTAESADGAGTGAAQRAAGKARREGVPRSSHAGWEPPADREDPVEILIAGNEGRVPELLPIRFGRMLASPFAFYRGAAAIMAADLARTPTTDLMVQACGDCHLTNFGGFGTPERRIIFDINDFDETLPASFEWDIKRLAASLWIAARNNGHCAADAQRAAQGSVAAYRAGMAQAASAHPLEVWYARSDLETLIAHTADAKLRKLRQRKLEKGTAERPSASDYPKLVDERDGHRIRDVPPLIYHSDAQKDPGFREQVLRILAGYRETLPDERRVLLDRFRLQDVAIKVVGVGSVGTFCAVAFLSGGNGHPLFLQVKEARQSVLEAYAGRSEYSNRGQRVVVGQRLMQAASDVLLGWTEPELGRHFYVRQLRDVKLKPTVEIYDPGTLAEFGASCGSAVARAHARSGDAALISGYLGKGTTFDESIADFAGAYADQNARDYTLLQEAVQSGRVEATLEG